MFGKRACKDAQSHAERKGSLLLVVMRWFLVMSLVSGIITIYNLVTGQMTLDSAHMVLASILVRLFVIGALLAWKPPYPVGGIVFTGVVVAIGIVSLFTPTAITSGRYLLYSLIPVVVAMAVLPPWTVWIVALIHWGSMLFLYLWQGVPISPYSELTYVTIVLVAYLAGSCLHSMVSTLIEMRQQLEGENQARSDVIKAIAQANGNGGSKEKPG